MEMGFPLLAEAMLGFRRRVRAREEERGRISKFFLIPFDPATSPAFVLIPFASGGASPNFASQSLLGFISGMISLFITKGKSSRILRFNEQVFFIYLLPPIIFNVGFQDKKKQFFHNFLTIKLFGVIGVFI